MSTTLVIHPKDKTTTFLKDIYCDNKDWNVVEDATPEELVKLINEHDRIIMMGHGSPFGLFATGFQSRGYIIHEGFVPYLKEKKLVGIWCNADQFFNRYELPGFYTGMIISEVMEAFYCRVLSNQTEVTESNVLFAKSIKEAILNEDNMLTELKSKYTTEVNPVIGYNMKNLYQR